MVAGFRVTGCCRLSCDLVLQVLRVIVSPKLLTELINKIKDQLPESEFVQSSRSYMLELSLTSWEACDGILVANGYSHCSCQRCGLATSSKRFWQVHSPEFCEMFEKEQTKKKPAIRRMTGLSDFAVKQPALKT